jgi:beta-mannosidase
MSCSGHLFARVEGSKSGDKVVLTLLHQDKTTFQRECRVVEDGLVKIAFQLDQPLLWYPHGYGPQSRYQLIAQLFRQDQKLDARSKDIGFRHVELVQEQDDFGKSFYFRINGIDTFAGGSCWIPGDSYLSQISNDRYVEWVKLAVESNQIMIRVWGGGIYEDDAFLDACDSLGVLIWHDFAFACASYPVYPSFLKSIEEEARQNIRRLRSHPSVVIWAGNNEDYQVQERYKLEYRPEDTDPSSWLKSTFPARYIYEYLLPKLVQEEDPSCIYHPGSPWGDGRISSDPSVGDIHQWDSKCWQTCLFLVWSLTQCSLAWSNAQIPRLGPTCRSFHQRIRNGGLPSCRVHSPGHHGPGATVSRLCDDGFPQQSH